MAPVTSMSKELAPLEMLQNSQHRRGSITDPSLHTASSYSNLKSIMNHHLDPKAALHDRPSPSYVFGNATPRPHSPNSTVDPSKTHSNYLHDKQDMLSDGDDIGSDTHLPSTSLLDHGSRRSSLAPASTSPGLAGTKRKLSSDRTALVPYDGPLDPLLPGTSSFDSDPELPPLKRRGSAVETQKIAMLSLDDRRGSVDSRIPGQWWSGSSLNGERRTAHWSSPQAEPRQLKLDGHGMPPPAERIVPDRRMSVPDIRHAPNTPHTARARSRPPSRADVLIAEELQPQKPPKEANITSYSRSPELRVSHKLAERKRRAEMKDLFEDLKEQLPAERGMKASKWEILSKAIDLVVQLKATTASQAEEIDALKRELAMARSHPHQTLDSPNQRPGIPIMSQSKSLSNPASNCSDPMASGGPGDMMVE